MHFQQRSRTALPATDEASTEKLSREALRGIRAQLQKAVELRNELEEVPESQEASVQRPSGASERSLSACYHVALPPAQNYALYDGLLAGVRLGVEVLDSGLGNPVQETKAGQSD